MDFHGDALGLDANGFWGYLARKRDSAKTAGQGDEGLDDDIADSKQKVVKKRTVEGMEMTAGEENQEKDFTDMIRWFLSRHRGCAYWRGRASCTSQETGQGQD